MKVALIFGEKSEVVKKKLQSQKDNLYIDCYPAVPQMINVSMQRGLIYDRILMLSDLVNVNVLHDLKQYWDMSSRNTSVVLLCRKGVDESVAENFANIFQTTVACPMLVESTTVNLVLSAVIEPVSALSQRYGLGDMVKAEADDGVDIKLPQQKQQPVSQPEQQPVQTKAPQQPVQQKPAEKPKKEKKSGGLFGRKKNKEEQVQAQPNQQMSQQVQSGSPNTSQMQPQFQHGNQQHNPMPMQGQMPVQQTQNWVSQPNQIPVQGQAPVQHTQPVNAGSQYNYLSERADLNFGRAVQPTQANAQGYPVPQPQFQNNGFNNIPQNSIKYPNMQDAQSTRPARFDNSKSENMTQPINSMRPNEVNGFSQSNSSEGRNEDSFENSQTVEQTPVAHEEQSPAPVFEETKPVDESVGNEFTPDVEPQSNRYSMRGYTQAVASRAETEDVDEDLGDLGVASIEESYRQENEAPKVIYKEVQKEVIVSSARTIDSILKGNNHIIYLVTGDRSSLVTTVSMKIAELVSKTASVLYVDCDTERHGILSHIEYDEFCKFEPTKMSGSKHCNSPKLLKSCVCNFASNFDLLTSDYSCDVSDTELKSTLETVSGVFTNYGVTVIDCPIEKLYLVPMNILLLCKTVVCVEASRRGYMNTLCELERLDLDMSYKRTFASTGTLLHTKIAPKLDVNKLRKYISSIYEADEVDWMSMRTAMFTGEVDKKLLGLLTNM